MSEQDGLCPLEVGVPRNDDVKVPARLVQEGPLQRLKAGLRRAQVVAEPEPEVQRDLVVAAPAGVQLAAHRPRQLRDAPLHGHMNIFVRRCEGETLLAKLRLHPPESPRQGAAFRAGKDAGPFQCLAMGETAENVIFKQAAVKGKRGGEAFHARVGRGGESPGAGLSGRGHGRAVRG